MSTCGLKAKLGVIAAVIMAGLTSASAATAATPDCPEGYTCIWKDYGYRTPGKAQAHSKFFQWMPQFANYPYAITRESAKDSATSVYNNGISERVRLFVDWHGYGEFFELAPKRGDENLADSSGAVRGGFNDTISSGLFQSYYGTHPWF